jgi:hypothetical protein
LARYRAEPESVPPLDALQSAAGALKSDGDESSARRVLEFFYSWSIEQHDLSPANFLGLAEVRLQSGDLPQAVALLRRMALVAGEPFENLTAAAQLLLKYGHASQATEFLSARVKAVPWDTRAGLDLAKAQIAGHDEHASPQERLSSLAASPLAPYAIRAEAAQASAQFKAQGPNLGSSELDLLAKGGPQDAAAVEQPGYFYARLEAAKRVSDPATQVRLLLGAVAIQPDDESPRLPLFRAAVGAGQYQLAYSALEPLLNPNVAGSYRRAYQNPGAAMSTTPSESAAFLPGLELSAEDRAALAGQVAEVLEKLHRWTEAANYWSTAIALAPAGSSRDAFQSRLEKANTKLMLQQQDDARRPVVTEHLEQNVLVRPRLSAKPEIAEKLPASGGGSR